MTTPSPTTPLGSETVKWNKPIVQDPYYNGGTKVNLGYLNPRPLPTEDLLPNGVNAPSRYSKQLDGFLPGLSPKEAPENQLQPHQMTPTEFANHPYAVFHGSDVAMQSVRESNPQIHVGSDAAAIQRGGTRNWGSTSTAALNTLWHVPENVPNATRVYNEGPAHATSTEYSITPGSSAPSKESRRPAGVKNVYYKNDFEDAGSTSLSIQDASRLKSQSDFVEDAIRNGKANEVHPLTMAKHIAGTLGIDEITKEMAQRRFSSPTAEWQKTTNQVFLPGLEPGGELDSTRQPRSLDDAEITAGAKPFAVSKAEPNVKFYLQSRYDEKVGGRVHNVAVKRPEPPVPPTIRPNVFEIRGQMQRDRLPRPTEGSAEQPK